MFKLISSIVIIMFFISNLTSQSSFIIGVSGGVSMAKQTGTGDFILTGDKFSRALKYGGGLDIGIGFGKFSLLSGARYNTRGGKSENNLSDPNGLYWILDNTAYLGKRETSIVHSVISIPLTLRYAFGSDEMQFFIGAGPAFNIMAGKILETSSYDLVGNKTAGPYELEYTTGDLADDLFKKRHLSTQLLLGGLYKLNEEGRIKFYFVFEKSADMVNDNLSAVDNSGAIYTPNGSIKNGNISFEIGYEHRINFSAGTKY